MKKLVTYQKTNTYPFLQIIYQHNNRTGDFSIVQEGVI
jgi:hypothetical protein